MCSGHGKFESVVSRGRFIRSAKQPVGHKEAVTSFCVAVGCCGWHTVGQWTGNQSVPTPSHTSINQARKQKSKWPSLGFSIVSSGCRSLLSCGSFRSTQPCGIQLFFSASHPRRLRSIDESVSEFIHVYVCLCLCVCVCVCFGDLNAIQTRCA